LLSVLGSLSKLLSACRVIGNLFMVEFSGNFSFSSSFSLVVLACWSKCFLLGILIGLSLLLVVGSIYQVVTQSLHSHSFILKRKKYTFFILAFSLLRV
jgi:hypothetical protein